MTDREVISARISASIACYNGGDMDGVMGCYSADIIKTRQGAAPETREQTVARHIVVPPRDGGTASIIERRFLEIWRKEGDRRPVARTMDNTP